MPNRDQLNASVARELRAASAAQRRRSVAASSRPAAQSLAVTPGRWLYPLDTAAYLRGRLRSQDTERDRWWPVTLNFPWIRHGDLVYFYTHDGDAGIVGFATVDVTDAQGPHGQSVKLGVDVTISKVLMVRKPLPASAMARWLHPPRGAVEDLRASIQDIDSALAGVPPYAKRLGGLRSGS